MTLLSPDVTGWHGYVLAEKTIVILPRTTCTVLGCRMDILHTLVRAKKRSRLSYPELAIRTGLALSWRALAAKLAGRSPLTVTEAEAVAGVLGVSIVTTIEPWTVKDDSPTHVTREDAAAHFARLSRSLDE